MPPALFFASGNRHKLEEVRGLLGIPLHSQQELAALPDWVENGDSFEANALIKARGLAGYSGHWALADDSGLEVDALQGAPGIYSARFAGEHGNDAANNRLLLEKLQPVTHRNARFVCALALCSPEGDFCTLRGCCEGTIAREASGHCGFGYDPLFVPQGQTQSFAELGPDIKAQLSHRAAALRLLKNQPLYQKFLTLFC